MRDYEQEVKNRVEFIREVLKDASASGIVYGNSGGKDCTLVGILCKMACDNTVGIIMPCKSKRNYEADKQDAGLVARQFNIESRIIDLSNVKEELANAVSMSTELNKTADINIAPRLRMTALYAVAASENRLVAGTGNRSERHMGYFTKWGDGACDFNPIMDLTVREIYEFLRYLCAPQSIIDKAPSAGLYDSQTDEGDMGITYNAIDDYLLTGNADAAELAVIEKYHRQSEHKRIMPKAY